MWLIIGHLFKVKYASRLATYEWIGFLGRLTSKFMWAELYLHDLQASSLDFQNRTIVASKWACYFSSNAWKENVAAKRVVQPLKVPPPPCEFSILKFPQLETPTAINTEILHPYMLKKFRLRQKYLFISGVTHFASNIGTVIQFSFLLVVRPNRRGVKWMLPHSQYEIKMVIVKYPRLENNSMSSASMPNFLS